MQLSKNTWQSINVPPLRVLEGGFKHDSEYELRQFADNRTSWSSCSAATEYKTGHSRDLSYRFPHYMYAIKAMQSLENTVASFIVSWDMRREHIRYSAIKN